MDELPGVAGDRAYFAQRAAEELELALGASDEGQRPPTVSCSASTRSAPPSAPA